MTAPTVHVLLGTSAEYIKTAPLLRLLVERGVDHRLVDAGQHAHSNARIRADLELRGPDLDLGGGTDAETIGQALRWAVRLAARLPDRRWLRRHVFGGRGGVVVVHGDTPSTLLCTIMAHRAGLPVAHIETGLRSRNPLHPFPEELIRVAVMRLADLLFAPDPTAVDNLRRMRVRGEVVPVPGNTIVEALAWDLARGPGDGEPTGDPAATVTGDGPVLVTVHRVENLTRRARMAAFADLLVRIAADRPVVFTVHPPTWRVLRQSGMDVQLRAAGVQLCDLVAHRRYVAMLARAPFVVTDGGSIQEEAALLGVPTLLWRKVSERPDGIGRNVVVSGYQRGVVDNFLADPGHHRVPPADLSRSPSTVILDTVLAHLAP